MMHSLGMGLEHVMEAVLGLKHGLVASRSEEILDLKHG